jgi:hypothetical protein
MLQSERVTFVETLCNSIRDEVIARIKTGGIPDNWNGMELRGLLAMKFERESRMDRPEYRKRRKAFLNDVLINNL